MKALVIGASGLVGGALLEALRDSGHTAQGTFRQVPVPGLLHLDITDAAAVLQTIAGTRCDIVFVPASLTNVDYCETHAEESFSHNVTGVRNVIAAGVPVVYFSSDYVFSGRSGPYRETDPVEPLNVYGRHKVLAEQSLPGSALVLRTTAVYGPERQGKNFVDRLVRTLRERQTLRVPNDQVASPTYAPDLARAAVHLAASGVNGVYHVAGPARASRYDFAREVAAVFRLDASLILAVKTAELGQAVPRPLNAGLLSEKARALLEFPLMDYHAGLREFFRRTGECG